MHSNASMLGNHLYRDSIHLINQSQNGKRRSEADDGILSYGDSMGGGMNWFLDSK